MTFRRPVTQSTPAIATSTSSSLPILSNIRGIKTAAGIMLITTANNTVISYYITVISYYITVISYYIILHHITLQWYRITYLRIVQCWGVWGGPSKILPSAMGRSGGSRCEYIVLHNIVSYHVSYHITILWAFKCNIKIPATYLSVWQLWSHSALRSRGNKLSALKIPSPPFRRTWIIDVREEKRAEEILSSYTYNIHVYIHQHWLSYMFSKHSYRVHSRRLLVQKSCADVKVREVLSVLVFIYSRSSVCDQSV